MDSRGDLYGEICYIIRSETKFLRHYIAKVTDNQGENGGIKVTVTEWGERKDESIWAFPRERNIQVPKVGGYVEIYFMGGDPNTAVYLGCGNEMSEQIAKNFKGNNTSIIFEDYNNDKNNIVFDKDEKEYKIGGEKITLLEGEEPYVLGDKFKTEFQKVLDQMTALFNNFTAWTPVPNDGGSALKVALTSGFLTKPQASATDILSEKIKGK